MRYAEPAVDAAYLEQLQALRAEYPAFKERESAFLELPDRESEFRWSYAKALSHKEQREEALAAIAAMHKVSRSLSTNLPHAKAMADWMEQHLAVFHRKERTALTAQNALSVLFLEPLFSKDEAFEKVYRSSEVGDLPAVAQVLHAAICGMMWRAVPEQLAKDVLQHGHLPREWGLIGPEDNPTDVAASRLVVLQVLEAVAAGFSPKSTMDPNDHLSMVRRFWREVRAQLDALPWWEPPIVDYLSRDHGPLPGEPDELLALRAWPRTRFDRDWESLYRSFVPYDDEPYGKQILLGQDFTGCQPQLLRRKGLSTHLYCFGPTGTGKTSGVLIPLITQLIRGYEGEGDPGSDEYGYPSPMLVIDLKGDQALYHTTRIEAQRRGQTFRLLTPDIGATEEGIRTRKTDFFDVFHSLRHLRRYPGAMASILAQAFEIEQGRGYGPDHFSSVYTHALAEAFNGPNPPTTWQELAERIPVTKDDRDRRGLRSKLELLCYEPVSHVLRPRAEIPDEALVDMPSVIANREVVYVYIEKGEGGRPGLAVAQLALWCFANALRRFNELRPRHGYAIVDEFQEIASKNVGLLMKMFRDKDSGTFIAANQAPDDLDDIRYGLSQMMRNEPGVQICTGIRNKRLLEEFQAASGEELRYFYEPAVAHTDSEASTDGYARSSGSGVNRFSQFGLSSGFGTTNGFHETAGPWGVWPMGSASESSHSGRMFSEGGGRTDFSSSMESVSKTTGSADSFSARLRAYLAPALDTNFALELSNSSLGALVWIPTNGPNRGAPFGVKLLRSQTPELYELLRHAPWPRLTDEEMAQALEPPTEVVTEDPPPIIDDDFEERLRDLELDDELDT